MGLCALLSVLLLFYSGCRISDSQTLGTSASYLVIEPTEKKVVYGVGDNFTIACIGSAPVQWYWEESQSSLQDQFPETTILSEELENFGDDGSYKRRLLHFTQVQYFNTGRYYCNFVNSTTATTTTRSPAVSNLSTPCADILSNTDSEPPGISVDVFVSDPNNMFIVGYDPPEMQMHFLAVYISKRMVLPCAVSDPSFNVTLVFGRMCDQETFNKDTVKFEPVLGFVIESPDIVFSGSFTCCAFDSMSGKSEERYMNLFIHDPDKVPQPYLITKKPFVEANAADTFNITCQVDVAPYTFLELHIHYKQKDDSDPRAELDLPRRMYIDQGGYDRVSRTLRIKDAKVSDAGTYECMAMGVSSTTTCHDNIKILQFEVKVYGEPYLHLFIPKSVVNVNETDEGVRLIVEFDAHPQPKVEWFHNGRLLSKSPRLIFSQTAVGASLTIERPQWENVGNYTIRASVGNITSSANITLLVHGKPRVYIALFGAQKDLAVVKAGEEQELICHVEGIPSPNLTWSFQEIEPGNFTPNPKKWDIVHHITDPSKKFELVSSLMANKRRPGLYCCQGKNVFGEVHSIVKYIVADEESALSVKSLMKREVVKGDSFQMVCRASLWMFKSISFFRMKPQLDMTNSIALNASLMNNASMSDTPNDDVDANGCAYFASRNSSQDQTYELQQGRTEYSWEAMATFTNLTKEDEGCYCCQAIDFDGRSSIVSYQLKLKEIEPPIIHGFSGGIRRVSENQKVIFTCHARGYPPPRIMWYKDNQLLLSNSTLNVTLDVEGRLTLINASEVHSGNYMCSASNYGGLVFSQNTTLYVGGMGKP